MGGLTLAASLLETLCQEMEAVDRDPSWSGSTQTQRGPSHAPIEGFLRGMKPGDAAAQQTPLPARGVLLLTLRFWICTTFRRTRHPPCSGSTGATTRTRRKRG